VPRINQNFFSEAIAGIEEACFENNHSLIICQSHERYKQECIAIETLIHQNVDCILISTSAETRSPSFLKEVKDHNIQLIQFDRCIDSLDSYKVLNDNKDVSFAAVQHLIRQGYRKIAFIGGPNHLSVFRDRKEGYLQAIRTNNLNIPEAFIVDNALSRELAMQVATDLLALEVRPDAFFTVSDHQSWEVLKVAKSLNIKVPDQLGIFGFANEAFTEMITPTLSSINQKSKELGKFTANLYFKDILPGNTGTETSKKQIIKSELIVRNSSSRNSEIEGLFSRKSLKLGGR
jgi:LacI family transcriptional regulator